MKLTLENIIKSILNEEVTSDKVLDSIRNKYYVRIKYDDGQDGIGAGNPRGSRVIQPMAIGTTKSGRPVVRAFQVSGNSRRGAPKWKFFRLDRITSWNPMPNKHFNTPPNDAYGEYNKVGDKTMGEFFDNAKFDDFSSPLDREKEKRNAPKISTKNVQGPVAADKQWKKNVYTSQPKSQKYAQYAKNIEDTSNEIDRFNDDVWAAAERERNLQNNNNNSQTRVNQNQQGPISQNGYDNNKNDYDVEDVDFNENEFFNNRRNR